MDTVYIGADLDELADDREYPEWFAPMLERLLLLLLRHAEFDVYLKKRHAMPELTLPRQTQTHRAKPRRS